MKLLHNPHNKKSQPAEYINIQNFEQRHYILILNI